MERVAFLVEDTGERLGCLLNPESVVLRRRAGVRGRLSAGGLATGTELSDDPLLFTGGGLTELDLDLLFDVSLAGSSVAAEDVRKLTGPLWDLAENRRAQMAFGAPPQVRFVWGKQWNIPGVVTAVAERLEYFTPGGTPRRSWLRMRMRRVSEPGSRRAESEALASRPTRNAPVLAEEAGGEPLVHEIVGRGRAAPDGGIAAVGGERLDQLADQFYGDSSFWRLIASFNDLDDPTRVPNGALLQIPPVAGVGGGAP